MIPPPDSEEPETARDPKEADAAGGLDPDPPDPGAAGGLDPYPPNPGLTLRTVAPHAILVMEMLLVAIVARGSTMLLVLPALLVLAAWSAWMLSRVDARHRPVAVALGAWAALGLVGQFLNITILSSPGPYAGLARAAYHLEQLTRLATAALPAWLALVALRKRPFPPGPSLGKIARGALWTAYAGAWLGLVIGYPAIRGDVLRQAYLGAELVALLVAGGAILAWALRRGWGPGRVRFEEAGPRAALLPRWYTWSVVLMIVAGDLVLLVVGAWRYGLFGEAYVLQQAGLLALWGTVAATQGVALALARRRG